MGFSRLRPATTPGPSGPAIMPAGSIEGGSAPRGVTDTDICGAPYAPDGSIDVELRTNTRAVALVFCRAVRDRPRAGRAGGPTGRGPGNRQHRCRRPDRTGAPGDRPQGEPRGL